MKIPFVNLGLQYESIKNDIDQAITHVIADSAFVGGNYVKKFESDFADKYGVKHVVGCGNGTDSLYIIMRMLGIGPGDEVITAANSWISSSETISETGAQPIFADVDSVYYSLDESRVEELINERTKAILVVHLQGQMCDIEKLRDICDSHGIYLIEDCAQSHFSSFKGRYAGLWGVAGSFSFYPGKNLGAYGDAGCIITNNDELARKCRLFANHGALTKHQHEIEGINSRLDGLQAAILSAKLRYIKEWTAARINISGLYCKFLVDIPEVILPSVRNQSVHTFHLFVIRAKRRNDLMGYLKLKGVEASIHYPSALPSLLPYKELRDNNKTPVADMLQEEILSLPMFPELKEQEVRYVADIIRSFYLSQA